jgi:uncharacterized repeat protein (TIGR01451 family)
LKRIPKFFLRTKSNYETASSEMKTKCMAQSGFGFWKILLTTALSVLFFAAFTAVASADTYYVTTTGDDGIGDGSSGNPWRTIQHAVNTIIEGDTIIVRDGTYTENVYVNKPHLTIRSENGAETTIVQAANPDYDVFGVSADYVNISGFTVEGATGAAGIILNNNVRYCTISNNNIVSNEVGIFLHLYPSHNTVINNNINSNQYGIRLYKSGSNMITNNNINSNHRGMYMIFSYDNKITENTFKENAEYGLYMLCYKDYDLVIRCNGRNRIYHNNFVDNFLKPQMYASDSLDQDLRNYLDDDYPSGGNYWSDYAGDDLYGGSSQDQPGSDGIGDTPYISYDFYGGYLHDGYCLNPCQDGYPLMNPWTPSEPDTTPPTVTTVSPQNGATDVAIDTVVTATFSEAMDSSTITTDSFTLAGTPRRGWQEIPPIPPTESMVSGTVTYDSDSYTATFTPDASLGYNHEYTATLSTDITDEAGNRLVEEYSWRFTTLSGPAPPPPDYFSEEWIEKVINWASAQEDKNYWYERCMGFVSDAFKVCEDRPESPNDLKDSLESAGEFYSKENGWEPTRGSIVFFSANPPYESYGHIGISLGGGRVIHSLGTVRNETIDEIEENRFINSYLGWAYPPEGWFSPKISNTFEVGDSVFKKEVWNLRDIPSLYGEKLSTESGNAEIIEDAGTDTDTDINGICNAGYYWWHIRFGDYDGWCAEKGFLYIELRRDGVKIDEIDVWEFFDIYVGASTDDIGIKEVRFSSDESQDDNPTGEWTEWYDWDTSSGDWDADTKIKRWAFDTEGEKEVWAEVKDDADNVAQCHANIFVHPAENQPPDPPTLLSQYKTDGTEIPVGGTTDESTVIFKGVVNDPDGDQVKLQIELRRLDEHGGSFTGKCTQESEWFSSGSEASITVFGLVPDAYHWQARAVDKRGAKGDWVSFGDNPDSEVDFKVSWGDIKKYAPILKFDSNERYFPCDIHGDDDNVINNHENYDTSDLPKTTDDGKYVCYYYVKEYTEQSGQYPEHPDFYVYEYWYYYAFNEYSVFDCYNENHEHDLESVFIWVDKKTGNPFHLALSCHLWFNEYEIHSGDELAIYVEKGGHGMSKDGKNNVLLEYNKAFYAGLIYPGDPDDGIEFPFKSDGSGEVLKGNENFDFRPLDSLIQYEDRDLVKDEGSEYYNQFKSGCTKPGEYDPGGNKYDDDHPFKYGEGKTPWYRCDKPEEEISKIRGKTILSIFTEKGISLNLLHTLLLPPNSPELRIYDSQGNVTGLVDGEVKEEISNSIYDEESKTIIIFSPTDLNSYRYEIVGTDEETYVFRVTSVEGGEFTNFTATNVPTAPGAVHQYTIDWEALARGEKGVTIQIDSDGDGIFEQTIITDNTFQPPIASFTYSPGYPLVEETITFNASSSYDPDGNITNYKWNFDDGNITDTTELLITHYYALAGDYTVNLTVTDDDGATNSASQLITVASASGICVNKTASPTEGEPGTTITFTINMANTGDCTLNPVKVVDTLPTGLNYISSYPTASTHDGSVIWNNVGPFAVGASKTLTLVAQIGNDAPALLTNTVTVTGTPPAGGNVTASGTANVIVIRLELEKSGSPATVAPGGIVTYTIKYSNPCGKDQTSVVITENYPEGITFISADPTPDAGTNNKWTIGTLPAGTSGTIIIKVKVPESMNLSFTESGSVTGEGFVMVSKDISTEQKPYSLKNVVTISCAELAPVSASAITKVSGVPGTSLELTEHGSAIYSSDEILNLQTKNKSIMLQKSTEAEYQPTSFYFSDGFGVNFATRWMQDICAKNIIMGDAMHKKIKDASYINDETITEVGGYRTSMEFESSFYGAAHIGTVSKSAKTSQDYIGEFEITWAEREECRYLFNWSRVPGNDTETDSEKVIQFLVDVLDLKWAENATITKSVDEMSINITDDGNTATITIDDNKKTATVKVGDETIYVLEVRIEDDTLNIYDCKLEEMGESVSGIGYAMLDKDLASGQMQVREHGSGNYSSDMNFESGRLDKVTEAEYQPTSFNFSDGFAIDFPSLWLQSICAKNPGEGTAIQKKISDASSMDDDTTATKSSMEFESSFNGSMHIGARTDGTRISEDYIGVFNITELIKIGKPAISTPSTPTPDWLPCPFPKPSPTHTSGLPCPSDP